jgi:hypothetical protein
MTDKETIDTINGLIGLLTEIRSLPSHARENAMHNLLREAYEASQSKMLATMIAEFFEPYTEPQTIQ